jgi:predicted MFS family arabinose efflux permease
MVAGVPLSTLLVDSFGIRGFYLLIALLLLGLLAAHSTKLSGEETESVVPSPPKDFRGILSHRVYSRALLASILVAAAIGAPMALFPTALQNQGGLDLKRLGMVYLFAGLGPLAAWPFTARLLSKFGPFQTARLGALVLGLPLLVLPLVAVSASWATLLLFLALLVETLRRSAMQQHVTKLADQSDRARFLAIRNVLVMLGIALGRMLATLLPAGSALFWASMGGVAMVVGSAALLPQAGVTMGHGKEASATR